VCEPPAELGLGDTHAYDHRFEGDGDEYQISYSIGFLKLGGAMKPALFAPSAEAMVFFCLSALDPVGASWYIDENRCQIAWPRKTKEGKAAQLFQLTCKLIDSKVATRVADLPKPAWEITIQEHGW